MMIRPGGAGAAGYRIARSLRFNAPDVPRLSNTSVASPTNDKICTFAFSIKRANLALLQSLIGGGASAQDDIRFDSGDALSIVVGGSTTLRTSSQLFRDPTAWLDFVIAFDTPQATASNRLRVYLNGSEITTWATNNAPAQNLQLKFNLASTIRHISTYNGSNWPMDGLLADFHFIDGQALTPSAFGAFDTITGEWTRKAYAGTYGNNGFRLDFSDNSNTTSSTLGKDRSGNNNDWTPTNFSVAAGAGNDSLTDTPTNYDDGTPHGNFPTLSAIDRTIGGNVALANGGLDFNTSGAAYYALAVATMAVPDGGKFYWEVQVGSGGDHVSYNYTRSVALITEAGAQKGDYSQAGAVNYQSEVYRYLHTGRKASKVSVASDGGGDAYGNKILPDDIVGVCVDTTNPSDKKIYFHKLGVYQNSGDPVAGTNPAFSGITERLFPCSYSFYMAANFDRFNFGQRPFAYTPPSGYTALCAQNLPDSESIILSGSFTGNAAADGPVIHMAGVPATLSIDGNAVTFGTHADKLSSGFKLRTASSPYNQAGTRNWTATGTIKRKHARAQ